jgi:hypothetical protein
LPRPHAFLVNEEERLRGGDAKIAACLPVEGLIMDDTEKIVGDS